MERNSDSGTTVIFLLPMWKALSLKRILWNNVKYSYFCILQLHQWLVITRHMLTSPPSLQVAFSIHAYFAGSLASDISFCWIANICFCGQMLSDFELEDSPITLWNTNCLNSIIISPSQVYMADSLPSLQIGNFSKIFHEAQSLSSLPPTPASLASSIPTKCW